MPSRFQSRPGSPSQRGYVMVLSIIMLLVITLLTVSMAKSFFFEEGMAGNVREKNRSFAAAQAALNYGEDIIKQGISGGATACTGAPQTALQACNSAVSITTGSSTSPFSSYFPVPTSALPTTYLNPTGNTIAQDTYYASPGVYVQYIGVAPGTGTYIYNVSAYGYGSTPNSVSIIQSTFAVHASTGNNNNAIGY